MKINDNIKNILEQGRFEGNIYLLPKIQLDRKDYIEVNKILMSLGGKWKTRVGHIFDGTQEELESALFEVLEAGETQTLDEIKKQFQFFETPEKVVKALIDEAELEFGNTILEPSVGKGAIIGYISSKYHITGVELNKECFDYTNKKYGTTNCEILNMDFLEYNPEKRFNKIIANPPFSKNQDVKHILHMYDLLEEGGKLVSIASNTIQYKTTKLHEKLKLLNPDFIELEQGSFKESGTMVNACIVIINK